VSIEVEHLTKRYGTTHVVDNVSLRIATGELFVLLGPSGSGKSTLLRMIAGLTEVDAVQAHPPGVGFVFQHYGLFRHMSVADNVEFALRVRKVPSAQRRERREELLQLVGLAGLADRYPRQLSGGQQQRVALARAIAHRPQVLLLDEPFGALDARIRLELRQALRRIQRELGLTAVFVTHDQEEAFELADRMAVLRDGRLLEVGPPQELYLRPRSPFVATFLGAANLLVGESSARAVRLGPVELPLASESVPGRTPRRAQVLLRPEDVEVASKAREGDAWLGRGVVESQASVAGFERLRLRLPPLAGVRGVSPAPNFGDGTLWIDALRPQHEAARLPLAVGDAAWVAVRRFHVLAPANLRLLMDSGTTPASRAAQALGAALASRLDAHASTLATGADLQREGRLDPGEFEIGAETERVEEGFDLLVLGLDPVRGDDVELRWLHQVRHHVMLVPKESAVPARLLVCVTVGEHGKADVRFAERLAWRLGASATVLTVLDEDTADVPPHVERFLESCATAISVRGVVTRTAVRRGPAMREIEAELATGGHDLLVIGSPHRTKDGRVEVRSGLVRHLLTHPPRCPLLLVRR